MKITWTTIEILTIEKEHETTITIFEEKNGKSIITDYILLPGDKADIKLNIKTKTK